MARFKLVDGVKVPFSPAEEAARDAEEAAYAAADHTPRPPEKTRVELIEAALIAKGVIAPADLEAEKSRG